MEITPIGFLFLLVILFLLCRKKHQFENLIVLCVITEIFIEMGFVFSVGTSTFFYSALIEDVIVIYSLFHIPSIRKRTDKTWGILIICYFVPVVLLALFPSNELVTPSGVRWDDVVFEGESLTRPVVNGTVLKMTTKFSIYTVMAIYANATFTTHHYQRILHKLSIGMKFFLILGIAEFVIKNILDGNTIWGHTLETLFGTSEFTVYEARLRGGTYELNLFTKEASHYAYALFLMPIIILADNLIQGKKNGISLSIFICIILSLISTSFSTLLFVFAFFYIFLLYRWGIQKPKTMKIEKILLTIGIIVVLSFTTIILTMYSDGFVTGRLLNLTENFSDFATTDVQYRGNDSGDSSTQIRTLSIIQTLLTFLSRPVFGVSLMSTSSHGATSLLLEGIGIVGVYFWTRCYFFLCPLKQVLTPQKTLFLLSIIIFFCVNLLNSLVLRPFYELTAYTMAICFIFIFSPFNLSSNAHTRKQNAKDI